MKGLFFVYLPHFAQRQHILENIGRTVLTAVLAKHHV